MLASQANGPDAFCLVIALLTIGLGNPMILHWSIHSECDNGAGTKMDAHVVSGPF